MAQTNDIAVTERLEILEKQMAALTKKLNDMEKKEKKEKKQKKKKDNSSDSDDDTKKKKRVTGYNLYVKTNREKAFNALAKDSDDKPKSNEVMKRLGAMWKELTESERIKWNTDAKALSENDA
tara:strand:+ start:709 stop:1077 length:369 start_codon:yes stop_codon:yes gene_type:complete